MKEAALRVFPVGDIEGVQQIQAFYIEVNERIHFFCICHLGQADNLHLLIAEDQNHPVINLHIFIECADK